MPLSEVKGQLKARAGGALKASRREDGRLSPQGRRREGALGSLGTSGRMAANHELVSRHRPDVHPSGGLLGRVFQGLIPTEAQNH